MKPKSALQVFLFSSTLLAAQSAHAQLTWDANGTGAGQTNGAGAWLGSNVWWNGTSNQNWVSDSDAIFGGPNTAGGAVTLASPTTVGSITFNTFSGTYTLGTTGRALTINGGITNNSAAGVVSLTTSPIILGASQTWTNSSSGVTLARSGVDNAGHTLTIDGNGGSSFDTTASIITGSGGLTKNGTGRLTLGSGGTVPAHNYSGTTTLNGGVTMVSNHNLGTGDLVLDGGVIESYWTTSFTRPLGNDPANTTPEYRIIGGASGFGNNNGGNSVILGNNANYEAVWGAETEASNAAATGFFNPSTFVLNTQYTQNTGITFQNKIDLNGSTRTIQAGAGTSGGATATISGVIRNTRGTAAGLIKTGSGLLVLTAANIYDGGTTINQGTLRFGSLIAMPSSGNVTVNAGATLTVEAGAAGDWTSGTSGVGTLGGLFAGLGSAGTSTVSFVGDATLGLEMTGNLTYAGDIPNLGTNLGITKSGGSSLTLTGNNSYTGRTRVTAGTLSFNSIANLGSSSALGAPTTAANGTINIGSGGTAATITYSGSGHSTDRVINLSGSTGGATIDASGSGALALTSALTATGVGAKAFVLTGSNTGTNALAATNLSGLAEVLTITKSGAGTWRINGFSSPKNAWSVTAGTLVLAGAVTTGDQQVTVSGGTLAGTGPITLQSGKLLTIQAAGSLAPGNLAVGTLALTGNLSVSAMAAGTGKLNFQIGAPASSDKITVTGSAQIGTGVLGFSDFIFTDMGGITPGTYVLVSTTAGITGTLDPANRSGLIGTINGTLQINGNNLEWSTDQDLDGIPDVYELANTTPPSATAFNPGDDLDTDGSTNLQEYIAGTNPNSFDTDADGIRDGYETNTGIWVSASNTGTNPLVLDSDGDTIRDGYETNTGTFASTTDTGTNPNKTDTDSDALNDNHETNTGTFVSKTNTGTDPNDSDTDNDGAGDWYEITASFTSPILAGEKPNVPYPLPDPDASTGNPSKKVKVYIMSGQSNMVGAGLVGGTDEKSLESMTRRQNKFPNLVDAAGAWTTRQDVQYRGVITDITNAKLSGGSLGTVFGPELGFGQVMGYYHDAPVLLIKSSDGNRALSWDFLPPGTPSWVYGTVNYAGYSDFGNWNVGQSPPTSGGWYAGKEFDRFFMDESQWARPDAAKENVVDVLDNFATQYPDWATQGFEIAGFVWWQGEKDGGDLGWATQYEPNLVRLINSLRTYYTTRYPGKVVPNAPFVLATLGEAALTNTSPATEVAVRNAHFAVDSATGSNPQINVKTVYSYPLSEGGSGNGHYGGRAGTYMLVGDALGRAMVDLESNVTPSTGFATWAATFPTLSNTDAALDFDKGGLETGIEWVLGGNPTSAADDSGLTPTIDRTTDPSGKLLFIFRRTTASGADANTAINVEYGSSLNGWTTAVHQGTAANEITITSQTNGFSAGIDKVTVALPSSLAASGKIFARLKVAVSTP